MTLHIDSWPWKIALVLALIGMREFVRLLSPKESNGQNGEISKSVIETLDSAAIAIGLVLFVIQPFLLQAFYIPSGSMEDTLRISDRLLVSKLIYRLREPRFQEVVVFRAPPVALDPATQGETDFIKRCIGTPGTIVYASHRKLYRQTHGMPQPEEVNEPYTKWNPQGSYSYDMKIVKGKIYSREYDAPNAPGLWVEEGPGQRFRREPASDQDFITNAPPEAVPPGKFLMLGDHRNNSNDSHVWGFVPRANIIGKAICVFWPPTRVGLVDRMSFHPRAPLEPVETSVSTPTLVRP